MAQIFFYKFTMKNILQGVCIQIRKIGNSQQANTLAKDFSQTKTISLDGKIAIITGAAEGIGLAMAKTFLKSGISGVTITDKCKEKGCDAAKKLACEYGDNKVLYVEGDMSESRQFDKVFKQTMKQFEGVNIVINNAGIMNDILWENQISSNLNGTVIGTLLGLQYMSKTCFGQGGIIINVASIMGLIPSSGYPIHTMTQFGIVGFSRAIGCASHYERTGVKVTALCPGLTNTRMLKQAPYHAINEKFRKEFKEESGGCTLQRPESVAIAAVEILDNSLSGSIWVVENNSKPYEIKFPEVADMRFKNKC